MNLNRLNITQYTWIKGEMNEPLTRNCMLVLDHQNHLPDKNHYAYISRQNSQRIGRGGIYLCM